MVSGAEHIDRFACPKGQTRIVLRRGFEDDFSPEGLEDAAVRPALLKNGYYASLEGGSSSLKRAREYDEGGTDKHLIDYFEVPKGIMSGELLIASRPVGNNDNDSITLGDFDAASRPDERFGTITFNFRSDQHADNGHLAETKLAGLQAISLGEFQPNGEMSFDGSLLDYLNSGDRPVQVDMTIADDTAVDFAALLLCQEPSEAKGTTFREFRMKPIGDAYSLFSCDQDLVQSVCDPYAGDQLCSVSTPISCYKDGSRKLPDDLDGRIFRSDFFVGGEVKLSIPVRPDKFATLDDANRFCESQFGNDWRVLSYHEAGGQAVLSQSLIKPESIGIVHVGDQPFANCWDRPKSLHAR